MTGMGHEDAFLRPRLNARYRFSKGTFAGTQGNGEMRRFPPFGGSLIEPQGSGVSEHSDRRRSEIPATPGLWRVLLYAELK